MLYVFHVDVGRMMSFDMTVALSSVENLKDTIERLHGIPAANIVLLVSGGEMLTQSTQVSYYSAGTDTNPIYMFLTGDARPSTTAVQSEPDLDLREQVERSMELPVCYDTVEKRAKLALRMHELARDEDRTCERLVHEQHLQQQGWSAVVANMEDLTSDFRLRFRDFCLSFDRHLEKRDKYLELLRSFSEDLSKLERIPILPGLMPLAEADFHGFDKLLENDDVFSNTQQESVLLAPGATVETLAVIQETNAEALLKAKEEDEKSLSSTSPHKKAKIANEEESSSGTTAVAGRSGSTHSTTSTSSTRRQNSLNLLQWITSKENHNALKLMSDECIQGLSTFNEEIYRKLKMEVDNIIKLAEQTDVKEIKGLGDRLCKLEELKYKIKGMVKDQKELSTALQQNQNRAMNLGDASVLPDLCASHQSQLMVMLQNHLKIRDHRRIIAKAKDELGQNLHLRLKRIVWIENAMSEFDNRLLFYHRCLRRAERHICIIEQIHQAPCIYVAAVTEVVRRRIFSGEFREWASKLSEDFAGIHSEEIKRRQLFNASFEGHFLNILFPGMHDMPPAFANDNSLVFDTGLPNLTRSDIDTLTSQLPDLATLIQLPDMDSVINFFVSRSGACDEELLKQQVANALNIDLSEGEAKSLLQHQRVSDLQKTAADVGCEESETDTETEFEQLPAAAALQSTTDEAGGGAGGAGSASVATSTCAATETMARSTATEPLFTQSATTLTEETDAGAIAELQRMRPLLAALHKLAMDCLQMARRTLGDLRADAEHSRNDLQADLSTLNEKWLQMQRQFQETEQAAGEQSNELAGLRKALSERDAEMATLRAQLEEMDAQRIKCATMETQIEELRDKLKAASDETNAAVAEAREELIHEHKTEIESLRCRFKLMTSMERSPSDTSLEKIERPTSSGGDNASNAAAIDLAQHEALLAQQREAFEVEKESAVQAAIEMERSVWQSKILPTQNSESVMATTNANILKDMLEEKERQLEQLREKDLIVTKENFQLKTRLDALTNDDGTSWMHEKIEILKSVKERLEAELASERAKRTEMETSFAATSRSSSSQKYIVLESCSKGDIVFVVWSIRHGQFMVVQDSQSLYFVHGDSLAGLNLRLPFQQADGMGPDEVPIPMPYYAIGRVIEKEYCQARKDENRYRVQRGSKFYRIKLEPLTTRISLRRDRLSSYSTSRSISQCESQSETAAMLQATSPPQQQQQQTAARAKNAAGATTKAGAAVTPSRDAVDASTITLDIGQSVITTTTTNSGQISLTQFKDRTISISSVNEEDDETTLSSIRSGGEQRYRYTSVSEEDELPATATTTSTSTNLTTTTTVAPTTALQHNILTTETVITEQPTATTTKELQMQLMLASADIKPLDTQQQQHQYQTQTQKQDNTITATEVPANLYDDAETTATANEAEAIAEAVAAAAAALAVTEAEAAEQQAKKAQEEGGATTTTTESSLIVSSTTTPIPIISSSSNAENKLAAATTKISTPLASSCNFASSSSDLLMVDASACCISASMPPTSIGGTATTSEDSDEFRSLEGRDDTDFPISE